jgi:transposase InsO family protein
MTHVRTSPNYPQSNGKLERWHKSLKSECIRPGTPLSLEDAKRLIQQYVDRYNYVRLHSAIGYVTPSDMLAGRQAEVHAQRDHKLEEARQQRQLRRQAAYVDMDRLSPIGQCKTLQLNVSISTLPEKK